MANYLELTNRVLTKLKEPTLSSSTFSSARGRQLQAKQAVNDALEYINTREFEWPFNAAATSQALSPGQTEYAFPDTVKTVDWESFIITADPTLEVEYKALRHIDRDVWFRSYRADDYQAGLVGRDVPDFVFPSHGTGFGVTPSPKAAYNIRYNFWANFVPLDIPTATPRVPAEFRSIIVDGALYYMYMDRENEQAAAQTLQVFDRKIEYMEGLLIKKEARLISPMVNFGGGLQTYTHASRYGNA